MLVKNETTALETFVSWYKDKFNFRLCIYGMSTKIYFSGGQFEV
jgi:hypothetical protein